MKFCYELKIPSPKKDMDGSMIFQKYWNGELMEIKKYCESDVVASIMLGEKMYKK
jgi:predicted PolB exonuclease-like 3'-5' exonuclease